MSPILTDWQTGDLTPNYRTVAWFESQGYLAEVIQSKRGPKSHDPFGFADVAVIGYRAGDGPAYPTLYVQATTGSNHAARRKKMAQNRRVIRDVLEAGNGVCIVSWRKSREAINSLRRVWKPRMEMFYQESDDD